MCLALIKKKIRFSNEHDRPFLAISGGHGETWAKGRVQHGIGISTSGLAYVRVAADGRSATIGGGSKTGAVIRALWAQGKQAGMFFFLFFLFFLFPFLLTYPINK